MATMALTIFVWFLVFPWTSAILSPIHHHSAEMSLPFGQVPLEAAFSGLKPLRITNNCAETIYPAFLTQAGKGPPIGGFRLESGKNRSFSVSADWQGRVWGRSNCSFNSAGTGPANRGGLNGGGMACVTGDCNGLVDCSVSGETPVTLAEFLLRSSSGQSFYDISLVDGYNLPMAIVLIPSGSLLDVPPNLTNPVCIGSGSLLAANPYSPYTTTDVVLGTNASYPLLLDRTQTPATVAQWCPWELQRLPPSRPTNGMYSYPDNNVARPIFEPCFSACAHTGSPSDCCTGSYNGPESCKPSAYSRAAKRVCPDAYSYAYDDQTSTFVIPAGGGFEVVFCPPGRSTNILTTNKAALVKLGQQLGERMVMYSEEMGRALEATNGEPRREENVGKEKSGARLAGNWVELIIGSFVAVWMIWG